MFQVTRTATRTPSRSIASMGLAFAAAAAVVAGPVASATARPLPEPLPRHTIQVVAWQQTMNELAALARAERSLAGRRLLQTEMTIVAHRHQDW